MKDGSEPSISQSTSITRSTNTSDATFYYNDKKDDVGVVDYRFEDYPNTIGFDIKNITSELSGNYLWLNMTMHDLIQDDENIYYKMTAANVEVLFFRGDGEIIYGDSKDSIVTYSDKTLSAKINKNEFVYDTFQITGTVYWDDNNETLGDYKIYDEVGFNMTNPENKLELVYQDEHDDVLISYLYVGKVDYTPEIDIKSLQITDSDTKLLVTLNLWADVESSSDHIYKIFLGNSKFEFKDGAGTISYFQTPVTTAAYSMVDESIIVEFEKSKLMFPSNTVDVGCSYKESDVKEFKDEYSISLPKFIILSGETFDLTVTMFDDNNIILSLDGTLDEFNSKLVRTRIDQIDDVGNNNGIAEQVEFDEFISQLESSFTVEDFFEFYPEVNEIPSQGVLTFRFENALGKIDDAALVNQTITGSYRFPKLIGNMHNITFKFLDEHTLEHIGLRYIFEFNYGIVNFNFSSEFQYWEFKLGENALGLFGDYLNNNKSLIVLPGNFYYMIQNQITVEGKFELTISLNTDLVPDDNDNGDDKSKKDESGFLPGFEIFMIVIAVIFIICFNVKRIR